MHSQPLTGTVRREEEEEEVGSRQCCFFFIWVIFHIIFDDICLQSCYLLVGAALQPPLQPRTHPSLKQCAF